MGDLIEAMARAIREGWRERDDMRGETVEWEDMERDERWHCMAQGRDALEALRAARPDVAALLDGEAVAVPKEPTPDMTGEAVMVAIRVARNGAKAMDQILAMWDAMLAASPYAQKEMPQ